MAKKRTVAQRALYRIRHELAKAAGLRSGEFGFTEREGEGGTR